MKAPYRTPAPPEPDTRSLWWCRYLWHSWVYEWSHPLPLGVPTAARCSRCGATIGGTRG